MIHFSDHGRRVWNLLDQNEALLIGDVLNLKMVNAVGGLRCGAGWLGSIVIGPTGGHIGGQYPGKKNCPTKEEDNGRNHQASRHSPLDIQVH